jgi:predicted AAA+ superfamily ATPase
MEVLERKYHPPRGSFFLFGPRGTGKTTLLCRRWPDALRIDLLAPEQRRAFLARPERLRDAVRAHTGAPIVVVDEIQKAPALLDVVHQMIEEAEPVLQFILTGSSSRKLKRQGADMLAGRAVPSNLHPLMACEMGRAFDLPECLQLGMVPLVRAAEVPTATLAGYVDIYLREEVQEEGLVRNVGDFARFLEAISFAHGSQLNTSEVARECEVGRKTVEGYISILEDLLLAFRIPVFSKRAKRILSKHSKFYYFDCGVFRSVRPMGPLDRGEEAEGAALEGLVAQHLRAWIDYRGRRDRLHFWRTKAGLEVDFVVYGQDSFAAIEVKNSRRVSTKDTRSLREFRADYPEAQTCLLYRGTERLYVGDTLCMPCDAFLSALSPDCDLSIGDPEK